MGNSLAYKSMLTRLESLLDKALRGIDLVELPIIVAVIAGYWLCRCNYGRVIGHEWADCVGQAAEKGVDCCAVLACYCIDLDLLY